jgi:hypothetical protein
MQNILSLFKQQHIAQSMAKESLYWQGCRHINDSTPKAPGVQET